MNQNEERSEKGPKTISLEKGIQLLPIASKVSIEIERMGGLQAKFKSQFVGYQPGSGLLFKMPCISLVHHSVLLQESNAMTVRGVSTQGEGAIIAFRSTILRHYAPPFAMIAGSIPEKIQLHLLRNEPRFNLDLHANIKAQDKVYSGELIDISLSGCCFSLGIQPTLSIEAAISIEVSKLDEVKTHHFKGKVKNLRKIDQVYMMGICFDKTSYPDVEAMLQEIVLKGSRL